MGSKSDNRKLIFWCKEGQMPIIICSQVPNFETADIGGKVKKMLDFFLRESRLKISARTCAINITSHSLYRCMQKEFCTLLRVLRKGILKELLLVPFLNAQEFRYA